VFKELSTIHFAYYADDWVVVRNFLSYNKPRNKDVWKHVQKLLDAVPKKLSIYEKLYISLTQGPHKDRLVLTPPPHMEREVEVEREQDQEVDSNARSGESPPEREEWKGERIPSLPLNDGSDHQVTAIQVEEWIGLYPRVDVMQELRNYRGWALANPKKRKTKSGILSSITFWLSDKQNKGGGNAGQGREPPTREGTDPVVLDREALEKDPEYMKHPGGFAEGIGKIT
jgi:hypothetical protein